MSLAKEIYESGFKKEYEYGYLRGYFDLKRVTNRDRDEEMKDVYYLRRKGFTFRRIADFFGVNGPALYMRYKRWEKGLSLLEKIKLWIKER